MRATEVELKCKQQKLTERKYNRRKCYKERKKDIDEFVKNRKRKGKII